MLQSHDTLLCFLVLYSILSTTFYSATLKYRYGRITKTVEGIGLCEQYALSLLLFETFIVEVVVLAYAFMVLFCSLKLRKKQVTTSYKANTPP
jgi:hypothetical protein